VTRAESSQASADTPAPGTAAAATNGTATGATASTGNGTAAIGTAVVSGTPTASGTAAASSGSPVRAPAAPVITPATARTAPAGRNQPATIKIPGSDAIARSVGIALTLLAIMVLGFIGYLYFLSGVQEARAQTTLYAQLQYELGQATAPTGPVAPGTPVAILNIPVIGVHNTVVVEGTTPENLTLGPGLLRDTVLPGQGGISVIFGRRATFGAPFARVPQLVPGDIIEATTSQGLFRYDVIRVSDSDKPVPFSELPNQLLLVTANSSFAPAHYVEVAAKLLSAAQPEPGNLPTVGSDETALGRDFYALIPAMAWAIALAAAAIIGSLAAARWSRWPAWIAAMPVILAIVWSLYQSLSALLPNLY
jgi:sortase A